MPDEFPAAKGSEPESFGASSEARRGSSGNADLRSGSEVGRLREDLMRCGALAISERADGCVPKSRALKIREIAYRSCWPEEGSDGVPA